MVRYVLVEISSLEVIEKMGYNRKEEIYFFLRYFDVKFIVYEKNEVIWKYKLGIVCLLVLCEVFVGGEYFS